MSEVDAGEEGRKKEGRGKELIARSASSDRGGTLSAEQIVEKRKKGDASTPCTIPLICGSPKGEKKKKKGEHHREHDLSFAI